MLATSHNVGKDANLLPKIINTLEMLGNLYGLSLVSLKTEMPEHIEGDQNGIVYWVTTENNALNVVHSSKYF